MVIDLVAIPGISKVSRVAHDCTAPTVHQPLFEKGVCVPRDHLEELPDGIIKVTGLLLPLEPL